MKAVMILAMAAIAFAISPVCNTCKDCDVSLSNFGECCQKKGIFDTQCKEWYGNHRGYIRDCDDHCIEGKIDIFCNMCLECLNGYAQNFYQCCSSFDLDQNTCLSTWQTRPWMIEAWCEETCLKHPGFGIKNPFI